ncbi:hypothetical protein MCOR02_009394 [Pyricularia oryzae]|nr:hypothetical protein MCOR02_009394 [Pyricularia oryzae]
MMPRQRYLDIVAIMAVATAFFSTAAAKSDCIIRQILADGTLKYHEVNANTRIEALNVMVDKHCRPAVLNLADGSVLAFKPWGRSTFHTQ